MAAKKVRAIARVQVTVEFAVGGQAWDDGATVEQINKQAREGAMSILRRGLAIEGTVQGDASIKTLASIVGEPKITAVLVEDLP